MRLEEKREAIASVEHDNTVGAENVWSLPQSQFMTRFAETGVKIRVLGNVQRNKKPGGRGSTKSVRGNKESKPKTR